MDTPSSSEMRACRASTRRAATSKPDESKIWLPMWECSPSSSSRLAARTCVTASKASPLVIEKPNFWSSWAVAMYSWVCASTPAVTRTITGVAPAEVLGDPGEPLDLGEAVDDDPADPGVDGAAQLGVVLLLPW